MADKPTPTPREPKRKGGRPTRVEASVKALRDIDLAAVDPVAVLREIAADRSQPGAARVAAARALVALPDRVPAEGAGGDINARAIALMRRAN
jgi:hypothetical protein